MNFAKYIKLWWTLFRLHATTRDGLRFTVRFLSQFLVVMPQRYLVVGQITEEFLPNLISRLSWFFGRNLGAEFIIQCQNTWLRYRVSESGLQRVGVVGIGSRLITGLLGKVLVHDLTRRWLKLDNLLRYKVFVINWTSNFPVSAWRLAAAVASHPFLRLAETISKSDVRVRSKEVLVLGNGPSAINVFDPEFAGMDVIVCNTAIKSARLLSERRIAALCFVDATFFIGPSDYCSAFYRLLRDVAKKHDFSIYIDFEHEAFLRSMVPELNENRIFPVYLDSAIQLRGGFQGVRAFRSSYSVFSSAMLPVAATCYNKVNLVGFDGKDPEMKNYFWKHNDEFQFTDLLPTVKTADPGFFKERDYVKQSNENDTQTEEVLNCVEGAGIKVVMTHPSFIQAMKKRYERAQAEKEQVRKSSLAGTAS